MLDSDQIKDWDGAQDKPSEASRIQLTPEQEKARKRRGQWLALGLFAFVILVFVLTMTKMGAQILVRDL
jgi:hypothetical protein